MSGVGKVPESVNKRSVTRLTQNPNHDEEVNVRDNSSVDLVQVQRGISDTPAEVLIQSNTHNSPAAELVQVNDGSQGGGESSDGEGDVEIEHIGDEGVQSQHVDGYGHSHQIHSPNIPVTFDVRKRTLISMWQRSILEELYKNGMTSASLQLGHLHATAVERTGLDIVVVKVSDCVTGVKILIELIASGIPQRSTTTIYYTQCVQHFRIRRLCMFSYMSTNCD